MNDTKYANAVGTVRAMENSLLTRTDIDQLINSRNKAEISSIIQSRSGSSSSESLSDVWAMLRAYAPDCKELPILLYRNDFHNLKAVLKAIISNREPKQYYIEPSNVELSTLVEAINSKEYDELPNYMQSTAEEAYELITQTLDGQLSDSLIDMAALKAMQKSAEECDSSFMQRYTELLTVCADIKTAYRCSILGKSAQFMESAICGSSELDKEQLIRAALGGIESLFSYLEGTAYSDAAALLKDSAAQYEKWCDDVIMELAETARMQAFGSEPLAAYFIAKEAEIKNLRILSVCKEFGADKETITERMRKLYV
ncbi:V0D/AC39 family V-type ATPase subunit [Ruminococcus flavefaciens]|uniref:V/A-type H+-transporting ATPase subunit C n=1 Tax=Ruminococcus flavefaciens TaxID=1265 RepID=A0A1K1LSE0_RUMFL|nr:V-type ATPase subunit [Ruminococcus flavefaciens]SFW13783.1 V/A-type H+-transporting ATPase subunit C [Ruminococcus flavefaciens]